MKYEFSGGIILTLLVLILVVAVPIKMGAHLADARRTSILWCGLAAVIGLVLGYVAAELVGDAFGSILAGFLGFVLGVRIALGSSFIAAIGIAVIAVALSLLSLSVLSNIGVIAKTPMEKVTT